MNNFDAFVGLCTEFVPFHGILHICYFSIMIQTGFLVHKSCKEYVSVNVLNKVINVAKYKAENSSLAPYILCVLFSVSNELPREHYAHEVQPYRSTERKHTKNK